MRILYDGVAFQDGMQGGGVYRYARELISRMASMPDVEASVYGPSQAWMRATQPVIRCVREYRLRENHRFCKYAKWANSIIEPLTGSLLPLRILAPDIFHLTYYRIPCQFDLPVVTLYDMLMERFPQFFKGPYCDSIRRQKAKCLKIARHIICISQSTQRDVIEIFDVAPGRTSVIYFGADLSQELEARHPPEVQAGLANRPYLLYVGARWPHKNFLGLLQAFASWKYNKEIVLLSAGGLPDWSAEEYKTIRQLKITDCVIKLAQIDDVGLAALYKSAICMVYPSFYEGFGLPVLEALQSAGVVALSKTSSLPEVAGEAGIYFDPNDPSSIAEALTEAVELSAQERQALISKGKEQAKKFTWDKTVEQTYGLYKQLLNEKD